MTYPRDSRRKGRAPARCVRYVRTQGAINSAPPRRGSRCTCKCAQVRAYRFARIHPRRTHTRVLSPRETQNREFKRIASRLSPNSHAGPLALAQLPTWRHARMRPRAARIRVPPRWESDGSYRSCSLSNLETGAQSFPRAWRALARFGRQLGTRRVSSKISLLSTSHPPFSAA